MTEDEVNICCKDWLIDKGYKYKGILNARKDRGKDCTKGNGFGQVPVPDGNRSVLVDHQGFRNDIPDLVWIEAKGSDINFSELLEGFVRTVYAVYHGGGNGYLAVPHAEYEKMLEQREFLKAVAESVNGKGLMGLLDAEKGQEIVL